MMSIQVSLKLVDAPRVVHLAHGVGEVAERSDTGEGATCRYQHPLPALRADLSRKRARCTLRQSEPLWSKFLVRSDQRRSNLAPGIASSLRSSQ
jgi:hypothetical protein